MTRKTKVQRWLLFSLLVLLTSVGAMSVAEASRVDLHFIESEEDLTATFEAVTRGDVGSIAIGQEFYFASAKKTKARIQSLIAHVSALKDRSVFMYGETLDASVAEAILDMKHPSVCKKPLFIGKRIESDSPNDPVLFCGVQGLSKDTSDEYIRKRIFDSHRREEKLIAPTGMHVT